MSPEDHVRLSLLQRELWIMDHEIREIAENPVIELHTCTIPRRGKLLRWGPSDVSQKALQRRCVLCQREDPDR